VLFDVIYFVIFRKFSMRQTLRHRCDALAPERGLLAGAICQKIVHNQHNTMNEWLLLHFRIALVLGVVNIDYSHHQHIHMVALLSKTKTTCV
jgi:hypothetical protein